MEVKNMDKKTKRITIIFIIISCVITFFIASNRWVNRELGYRNNWVATGNTETVVVGEFTLQLPEYVQKEPTFFESVFWEDLCDLYLGRRSSNGNSSICNDTNIFFCK